MVDHGIPWSSDHHFHLGHSEIKIIEPRHEKTCFLHIFETEGNRTLIIAFVFATLR